MAQRLMISFNNLDTGTDMVANHDSEIDDTVDQSRPSDW